MEPNQEEYELTQVCCSSGDDEKLLVQWFTPEMECDVIDLDDMDFDHHIITDARQHPEINIFLHVARIRMNDIGQLEIKVLERERDDSDSVSLFCQVVGPTQILPEVLHSFLLRPTLRSS